MQVRVLQFGPAPCSEALDDFLAAVERVAVAKQLQERANQEAAVGVSVSLGPLPSAEEPLCDDFGPCNMAQ